MFFWQHTRAATCDRVEEAMRQELAILALQRSFCTTEAALFKCDQIKEEIMEKYRLPEEWRWENARYYTGT